MSRQGLRSATGNNDQEDLDRTLTEVPEIRRSLSTVEKGGHSTDRSHGNEEHSESLTRKLEDLEKRVKKMLEDERKEKLNRSLEVATGITQTLEERNNRIEAQFGILEAQKTRIMKRINSEEGRRGECSGLERNSNIKYILPQFKEGISPIRYMNQFKQYWEALRLKNSDTHYLIERSLTGPPGDWWKFMKDEVNNFVTFLNRFSRRFWNEQAQHELRRELEYGCHHVGKWDREQNMPSACMQKRRNYVQPSPEAKLSRN